MRRSNNKQWSSGAAAANLKRKKTCFFIYRRIRLMCRRVESYHVMCRVSVSVLHRSQVLDSSPFDDSHDELMYKMQSTEDSLLFQPQLRGPTLSPCKSPVTGFTRTPPKSQEALYPSIIHNTPERKRYSAVEWDAFTKKFTETALEELVVSPDFGKWLSTNADRISVTPNSRTDQQRGWMFWS